MTELKTNHLNSFIEHGLGIHFAIDTAHPNAFTWATVELALELKKLGVSISIPPSGIHDSIPDAKAQPLRTMMSERPQKDFHIKWSHYWPHHMQTPLAGTINAEIMCTNYRYAAKASHLDLWTRHVQLNNYRKVPVSRFNQLALQDIGFEPNECPVIPLGYSPEIEELFPDGEFPKNDPNVPLNILLVTNSNDLYRYGTDLAIKALAQAYTPNDNVVIHIKDYGAGVNNGLLDQWIQAEVAFPETRRHTDFLSKEDLLKLYASMDFLIAPFRGEGFSMKIIDAMAIGIPVMMPAFGGPETFATDGTFLPLTFKQVPVGNCFDRQHYELPDTIYWCECEADNLTDQLKRALTDREWLASTGRKARAQILHNYSWHTIALQWIDTLTQWHDAYNATLVTRCTPDTTPLTVLIPTKDRVDILAQALASYSQQDLPTSEFELLIVNDHGDLPALEQACQPFTDLNIRVIDNTSIAGPAGARNFGMQHAQGQIVLITGDDIIPSPSFVSTHLDAHRNQPDEKTVFLGFSDWHPSIEQTPFHQILLGEGGYQFDYGGLQDMQAIDYGRFYTSNISLKRSFLNEQEHHFSTAFPYAAFEDIEFAYRLHLQGMQMFFLKQAVGYHLHDITPDSFVERQRKAGAMLTLYTLMQPSTPIAIETIQLLESLEQQYLSGWPNLHHSNTDSLIENLLQTYKANLQTIQQNTAPPHWVNWMKKNHRCQWEAINQLALHAGMANAWATTEQDIPAAKFWITQLILPRITGPSPYFGELFQSDPPHPPPQTSPVRRIRNLIGHLLIDRP